MTFKKDAPDEEKMKWFRNIPAGAPFTPGDVSGDYSLQLMAGYANYRYWRLQNANWYGRIKMAIPYTKEYEEAAIMEAKRAPLRAGPSMDYSD